LKKRLRVHPHPSANHPNQVKRSANGDFSPLALLGHSCRKFLIVKDEIAGGDALSGRP